jgi:hypothetical protein
LSQIETLVCLLPIKQEDLIRIEYSELIHKIHKKCIRIFHQITNFIYNSYKTKSIIKLREECEESKWKYFINQSQNCKIFDFSWNPDLLSNFSPNFKFRFVKNSKLAKQKSPIRWQLITFGWLILNFWQILYLKLVWNWTIIPRKLIRQKYLKSKKN